MSHTARWTKRYLFEATVTGTKAEATTVGQHLSHVIGLSTSEAKRLASQKGAQLTVFTESSLITVDGEATEDLGKKRQLQEMDQLLTRIEELAGAAGIDDEHGLPGILQRLRYLFHLDWGICVTCKEHVSVVNARAGDAGWICPDCFAGDKHVHT